MNTVEAVVAVLRAAGVRGPAHNHGGGPSVYARCLAGMFELSTSRSDLVVDLAESIGARMREQGREQDADAGAIAVALRICAACDVVSGLDAAGASPGAVARFCTLVEVGLAIDVARIACRDEAASIRALRATGRCAIGDSYAAASARR